MTLAECLSEATYYWKLCLALSIIFGALLVPVIGTALYAGFRWGKSQHWP